MDAFKHRYLGAGPAPRAVDRTNDRVGLNGANDRLGRKEIVGAPGLKYSSPWPWVLAAGISLSMWAGLASVVWRFA